MDEATEYKKYLKGLERIEAKNQLDKATKKVKAMEAAKAPVKNVFEKAIGVFPKINKDTLHKTLMSGKNPYSDLVNTTNKEFVKRRMELAGKGALDYAAKAAKASKYGKIAAGVAGAGIAASAYLRSKMKDIKEKQQAEGKKYHGGMMHKKKNGGMPKYDIGGGVQKAKEHKEKIKDVAGSVFGYIGEMSNSLKNLNPIVAGTGYAKDYIEKKIKKPKDEKAFRELPDSIKKRPRNDNRPSVQDRIRNRPERFFPPSNKRPQYLSTGGMKKYKSGSMVYVKTKIGKNKPTKIC